MTPPLMLSVVWRRYSTRSNPHAFAVGMGIFQCLLNIPPDQNPSQKALFKGTLHQDSEHLHRIEPRIFIRVRLCSRSLDVCALSSLAPSSLAAKTTLLSKGGKTVACYPFT
jgi:hypothetical protein